MTIQGLKLKILTSTRKEAKTIITETGAIITAIKKTITKRRREEAAESIEKEGCRTEEGRKARS